MSNRPLLFGLLWLAGLASLSGCGAPFPGDEAGDDAPLGASEQRIMGGTSDATDVNVVDIIWLMSGGFSECSGSLLAPNMVLTAHHCVSNVNNGSQGVSCGASSFAAPAAASNFYVSTKEILNTSSPTANAFHKVSQIVVPPNSTNNGFCGVDQAILILADNVQPSEAVPLVPRVDTHVQAKELYSAVGFGITSDTASDSGTRRRLNNLHRRLRGHLVRLARPRRHRRRRASGIGDHGTCEGDSGGPALDAQGRVFGVTSRGGAQCSSPIYGDVYDWADWIKQTAQMAASLGGYTAPPWVNGAPTDPAYGYPVGGACDATCKSGFTLDDAEGCYCTRECETAAPCPTGYTCETISNVQLCQRNPSGSSGSGNGGSSGGEGGGSTSGGVSFQKASGCSMSADPTKPVPWLIGVPLAALVGVRRRRRRASR